MQLRDVFKKLSYGELSSLSLGSSGEGSVDPSAHGKVIHLINEALMILHTRFILVEKEVMIQSLDWKSTYELHPRHSLMIMEDDGVPKYIVDTPAHPFDGRLIKILSVTNEIGQTLPLNDTEQYASVFTPRHDTLQITHPGFSQAFSITYQSAHPLLLEPNEYEEGDFEGDVLDQEVTIPPTLEEALLKKVAEKVYSPMSGQDMTNKAAALGVQFETICREIEEKNLLGESNPSTNVKLYRRGFR